MLLQKKNNQFNSKHLSWVYMINIKQTLEKGDTDFGPVQSWSFLAYLLKYICLSLDFQSGQNEECEEEDKCAERKRKWKEK